MSQEKSLANNAPIAYGYSRVSHIDGFRKGDSCDSQEARIKQYYETFLKEQGVAWGHTDNDGENVSAFKVKFNNRPAGRRLIAAMKPGDHLIVDKVDRFWRSIEDFVMMMKLFDMKKIVVHIVNFLGSSIQSNTPMGSYMLKHFVLVAELESAIKSERIRESLAVCRRKGLRSGNATPPGTTTTPMKDGNGRNIKNHHGRTRQALRWCEKTREMMAEICRLIDDEGMEWLSAFNLIEEFIAEKEGRPIRPIHEQYNDREHKWRLWHKYENAYRYLGIREVSQIPDRDVILMAAKQARREKTERRGKKGSYKSKIRKIEPEKLLNLIGN
jgi:DNA invertase Pin-like site-specific DNA recombinase